MEFEMSLFEDMSILNEYIFNFYVDMHAKISIENLYSRLTLERETL